MTPPMNAHVRVAGRSKSACAMIRSRSVASGPKLAVTEGEEKS
jgi:hypothetical protein